MAFSAYCLCSAPDGARVGEAPERLGRWSVALEGLEKLSDGAGEALGAKMRACILYVSPDHGEDGVEAKGQQEWLLMC